MRKTSNDILLYMLNTSFSHDIILIEGTFSQFSVVLCSELMFRAYVYVTYLICQVTQMSIM